MLFICLLLFKVLYKVCVWPTKWTNSLGDSPKKLDVESFFFFFWLNKGFHCDHVNIVVGIDFVLYVLFEPI